MRLLRKKDNFIYIIMIIAVLVRIWDFPNLPGGLNQDEASAGYDAWSIAHFGIDRNGTFLPSYHISWGSGANVLLSYLLIPFIRIFGLAVWVVRLPSLLMGIAAVWVFYLLLKRLHNVKIALFGAFFFSICPWHIMASRWALESNLLPNMLLFSFTMLVCALQDNKMWQYALSGALFSLSVYAYSTVAFVMPLIVIGIAAIILLKKDDCNKIKIKKISFFLIPLAILSIPIGCFYLVNIFGLPEIHTGIFTAPKLTTWRSVIAPSDFINNARALLDLMIHQNDGLPWNQLDKFGVTYKYMTPFALFGFFYLNQLTDQETGADDTDKTGMVIENNLYKWVMHIWMISAIIVGCLIQVNINRINIIWIPLVYFCITGIMVLSRYFKQIFPVMVVIIGISLVMFISAYFGEEYRTMISGYFYDGYGEAAVYADSLGHPVEDLSGVPYTNALFYTKPDPRHFVETVVYTDPNAEFRPVGRFAKWYYQDAPPNSVVIRQGIAPESEYVKQFGNYYVETLVCRTN